MKKPISHYERLHNPAYIQKCKYKASPHVIHQRVQELDEETQRVKTTVKYITRADDDLKHYKVSDFYLENLQLSGAIDNLKNITLQRDAFSQSAHLNNVATQIVNSSNNENKE